MRIKAATIIVLLALSIVDLRAQSRLPRFEDGECLVPTSGWPDSAVVQCGYLVVPESRRQRNGPTVRLPVALFRARTPTGAPPLVMLHGGPGGGGGLRSNWISQMATWPLAGRRDIVIYDQRGAGMSEPRLCPDVVERAELAPPERVGAFLTDCVARLRQTGRDPSAYSTRENAADAIDLRRTLGYETWDVYGVSYGSRLAQELMRQDAQAIHSVVLTGVLPPGPRPYVELRMHVQEAFERLFARCQQQLECAQTFPTLEQDFYETHDVLMRAPMMVQVPGDTSTARLDGARFVELLRRQLNAPNLLPRIPMLIRELHHGDRERAAQLLMTAGDNDGISGGTPLLVSIIDVCGSNTLMADARDVQARVRAPFRNIRTLSDIVYACEPWPYQVAKAASFRPIDSDIPTLVISAEFDDRTPALFGRTVAATLQRSYNFEIPREAHGQLTPGCHTDIVVQFLENPSVRPDGACLETIPAVAFETTELTNVQKFTFRISAAETSAQFEGDWESVFPGSYGVTTVDLQIVGTKVTGTISQPRATVNVFDGRVDNAEIILKATSGDGDRTITLRGKPNGDEITFTRELAVRPGGFPGTQGIFGAAGPSVIVANRLH